MTVEIPAGEFVCRVPFDVVEQLSEWTPVSAVRMVKVDRRTVEIQFKRAPEDES